jgi:hypothetical protein
LVKESWPAIEAVAEALLRRRVLSESDSRGAYHWFRAGDVVVDGKGFQRIITAPLADETKTTSAWAAGWRTDDDCVDALLVEAREGRLELSLAGHSLYQQPQPKRQRCGLPVSTIGLRIWILRVYQKTNRRRARH